METTDELGQKWDLRHAERDVIPQPAEVLAENLHLFPKTGDALDLACGLGANALLLAERGLSVAAWDLSQVAIDRLEALAGERNLRVQTSVRDVLSDPPEAGSFDLIVVSYFLDRDLVPDLISALRPGGLLFYQTFVRDVVGTRGPSNPDYRLARNELLQLFGVLRILFYREDGLAGDVDQGIRDVAMLVGQKPSD